MVTTEALTYNARDIQSELNWFREVLRTRSTLNAGKECAYADVFEVPAPVMNGSPSAYNDFVKNHNFGFAERFMLMLALVPHIRPEMLDMFLVRNEQTQQVYTEFGGKRGKYHNGFLPTAETAMFILAGNDLEKRFALLHLFSSNHVFFRHNILQLEEVTDGEPVTNGALVLAQDILDMFTTGKVQRPKYSGEFPAQQLSTSMDWEDLVLNPGTLKQYQEIEIWLQHEHKLMREWGMERKLKPGYKSLFFGPPGTGKTLTAALLGKKTGRDVFKIDLSRLVSKYIGETEKNLSKVFNKAEHKDWILFFDEADSLFSKRTGINDAHDRYANQEVSYLLQRMEEYNGLIILATNLKSNVDDAFLRRFQSIIHFPMPTAPERLEIWRKGFSEHVELDAKVDLKDIASKYELSGGPIMNVIQYACLMALNRDSNLITQKDIMDGIRKEFGKSGRTA